MKAGSRWDAASLMGRQRLGLQACLYFTADATRHSEGGSDVYNILDIFPIDFWKVEGREGAKLAHLARRRKCGGCRCGDVRGSSRGTVGSTDLASPHPTLFTSQMVSRHALQKVRVDGGWGRALALEVMRSDQIDPGRANICRSGVTWLPTALTLRSQESNSETGWLVGSEVMDEEVRGRKHEWCESGQLSEASRVEVLERWVTVLSGNVRCMVAVPTLKLMVRGGEDFILLTLIPQHQKMNSRLYRRQEELERRNRGISQPYQASSLLLACVEPRLGISWRLCPDGVVQGDYCCPCISDPILNITASIREQYLIW
ncbi:hypothetical protein QTO34_007568 [Cnephaeus nilssonii]|uniref:Uncharacterized protein n=1 Tax=Cnephaeus nilssonii TaxID=3371016 RepID=A0AA40LGX8_CNENI|nr:hypothetical protein QTO34_007568 [Eptesicus nilssonii]